MLHIKIKHRNLRNKQILHFSNNYLAQNVLLVKFLESVIRLCGKQKRKGYLNTIIPSQLKLAI